MTLHIFHIDPSFWKDGPCINFLQSEVEVTIFSHLRIKISILSMNFIIYFDHYI
jgi:hypothetical protein